eukprot:4295765-Amphidinium_carterae.1
MQPETVGGFSNLCGDMLNGNCSNSLDETTYGPCISASISQFIRSSSSRVHFTAKISWLCKGLFAPNVGSFHDWCWARKVTCVRIGFGEFAEQCRAHGYSSSLQILAYCLDWEDKVQNPSRRWQLS